MCKELNIGQYLRKAAKMYANTDDGTVVQAALAMFGPSADPAITRTAMDALRAT